MHIYKLQMSKPAGHVLANIRAVYSLRSTLVSCGGGGGMKREEGDRRDRGRRKEKIQKSKQTEGVKGKKIKATEQM